MSTDKVPYYCIKSVIMHRSREQTFTQGKVYLFDSYFDTHNDMNEPHSWTDESDMKKYFIKESEMVTNPPDSIVSLTF